MRIFAAFLVAMCVVSGIACEGFEAMPTRDLEARVAAGVQATLEANAALDATVEARVAATLAAHPPLPTPEPTAMPRTIATQPPTATPLPATVPTPTPLPISTQRLYPTATPYPIAIPLPTSTPTPEVPPGHLESVQEYAARMAGGPGAIYVGDLNQLAGPAVDHGMGDSQGMVPLESLEGHLFVYESQYYKNLLVRARLDNPTAMTTRLNDPVHISYACVNRALLWCDLAKKYLSPNLSRRTRGQIVIEFASYRELAIAGSDTLELLRAGLLPMAEVFPVFVSGELPQMDILGLYGLYTDRAHSYEAVVDVMPDLQELIVRETGGYPIGVNWQNGGDLYLFSERPVEQLADFQGLKTRSFNAPLSDWIEGMGGTPQFVAVSEVYTALARGITDASISTAETGYGQQWYEVSSYFGGPIVSWPVSFNVINAEVWDSIPIDLQEIMKEEVAKLELEALRLAAVQNDYGPQKHYAVGLEHIEFGPELKAQSEQAALESVIPGWVKRLGGPSAPFVDVFNRIHESLLGVRIEEDGTAVKTR